MTLEEICKKVREGALSAEVVFSLMREHVPINSNKLFIASLGDTPLVKRLHKDQRKHLDTVLWLTGGPRASGRTTLLATAFLLEAMNSPGMWVPIFDHSYYRTSNLLNEIDTLFNVVFNHGNAVLEIQAHLPSIKIEI